MKEIKLPRGVWYYHPERQLGPEGGFGTVFLGKDSKNNDIAVKRIKLNAEELAHRELDIAEWMADNNYEHLIPIFDAGQDSESGSYFVVMSKAEFSLQNKIERDGIINDKEATLILYEIAQGLLEMRDLVHRDLKPDNILFHESMWKLADFGIARFVENATSQRTVKACLTPPYAAPEQWKLERSTKATDVYALGCIGYFLLTGSPPFTEDFQHHHLHVSPLKLEGHNSKLSSIIHMMLRKTPETRPSIERIKKVFDEILNEDPSKKARPGFELLSDAGEIVAKIESEKEAELNLKREEHERRINIYNESIEMLNEIISIFKSKIMASTPVAKIYTRSIQLGDAEITFENATYGGMIAKDSFKNSGLDIISGHKIKLFQDKPRYFWSASLWFMTLSENSGYRWYEVSYFDSPLSNQRHNFQPFAIEYLDDADIAHSQIMGKYQIAYGPLPIDGENVDDFCDRWANLLARAAQGRIGHPSRLPLRDNYFNSFK